MIKRLKNHPWDETLVIGVMVVCVVAILIFLAGYISVTGMAGANSGFSFENVFEMVGSSTIVTGEKTGRGTLSCNSICANEARACIMAFEQEMLVECSAQIKQYKCVCSMLP